MGSHGTDLKKTIKAHVNRDMYVCKTIKKGI